MSRNQRHLRMAAVAASGLLILASCASDSDDNASSSSTSTSARPTQTTAAASGPATVSVTATDNKAQGAYAFTTPASVSAGPTRFALANTGGEAHHAQLFKLGAGKTMADVGTALGGGGGVGALLQVGTFEGGTGAVSPGGSSTADAVVNLTAGNYAFMCFLPNSTGAPHIAAGMVQPFVVTATSNGATAPQVAAQVTLADYAFGLPTTISGNQALSMNNTSQMEPHEMNIFKVDAGVTADDVLAFIESTTPPTGPPKFSAVGGMQALLPGASQTLQLNLAAGRYVVLCIIPSVVDEVPHAVKGMKGEFTVA